MAKKKRVAAEPRVGPEHIAAALDIVQGLLEDIRAVLTTGKLKGRKGAAFRSVIKPCPPAG